MAACPNSMRESSSKNIFEILTVLLLMHQKVSVSRAALISTKYVTSIGNKRYGIRNGDINRGMTISIPLSKCWVVVT